MPYTPPGILVNQVVETISPVISTPILEAAIVGPNFDIATQAVHATNYDATTGAAAQSFTWPSKAATAIVDLIGVRSGTARFDGAYDADAETGTFRLEEAVFPVRIFLKDPISSAINQIAYGDITSVDQADFTIAGNVGIRNDRITVLADVDLAGLGLAPTVGFTGSEQNHFHYRTGDLLASTVSVGDRVHLYAATDGLATPLTTLTAAGVAANVAVVRGTVTAVSDDDITLSVYFPLDVAGIRQNADIPFNAITRIDGDLNAVAGRLDDVAANSHFLAGNNFRLGARLNIGQEEVVVADASLDAGRTQLTIPGSVLTAAHAQRRVVVGIIDVPAENGGWTTGTGVFISGDAPGTGPFLATHLNARVRLNTDAGSFDGRITTVTDTETVVVLGLASVATDATSTLIVYADNWARIQSVDLATNVATLVPAVPGGPGALAALPAIIYSDNHRNIIQRNGDNNVSYSGTNLVGVRAPVDVNDPAISFEIFPNYQVLASYRAMRVTDIGDIIEVNSTDDLTGSGSSLNPYGAVNPANPLVFNMNSALEAMGTDSIRVAGIPIDLFPGQEPKSGLEEDQDADQGYSDALAILGGRDLYSIVPLTRSVGVRSTYTTHVTNFSLPEDQVGGASLERRAIFTVALPLGTYETSRAIIYPNQNGGNKQITRHASDAAFTPTLTVGDPLVITRPSFYAGTYEISAVVADTITLLAATGPVAHNPNWTVEADPMVHWTANTAAAEPLGSGTTAQGAGVTTITVVTAGNQVTQHILGAFTGAPFDFVAIGDVLSIGGIFRNVTARTDITLDFDGGPLNNPAPGGVVLTIFRQRPNVEFYAETLSKSVQADTLKAIGESIGNKRATIVWPDTIEITVSGALTPMDSYPLASALAGMCSSESPEIPLNDVAVGGIDRLRNSNSYFDRSMLNTIASGGVSVYTQASPTASVALRHQLTTDMSVVENAELSIVKNLDAIAKTVRATLRPSLRRAVITPRFLRTIEASLQAIFSNLEKDGQLVGFDGNPAFLILRVARNTSDPRQVDANVDLGIPYPGTYVNVTLII